MNPLLPASVTRFSLIISWVIASLLLVACGGGDGALKGRSGGEGGRPVVPQSTRKLEVPDLVPADLDLVARIDLERMTGAIGSVGADALSRQVGLDNDKLGGAADEAIFKSAIQLARVVWIGVRLADLEAGDRVVAFEGDLTNLDPARYGFRPLESEVSGITIVERTEATRRSGTARIIQLGARGAVFVSPMEVDSVARVLRDGPDARRGDPTREGIVSLDVRPRRLSPSLEQRFPSIGAIISGIHRIRAAVIPEGEGLRVDAEIRTRSPSSANRVRGFIEAMRDNVEDPQYRELMQALSVEQLEDVVRVRWFLAAKALTGFIRKPDSRP